MRRFYKSLTLALLAFAVAGCDVFHTQFDPKEDAKSIFKPTNPPPSTNNPLRIMTYNIKFGGARIDMFFDCHGDTEVMSGAVVLSNMEALAKFINEQNPDILFLQEVDRNSTRSGMVDEFAYLIENTKLHYGVYASQWKSDWIPTHHLGQIDSGIAILSKFPLHEGVRYAYPPREDVDFVTRYFYLKRGILETKVRIGSKEVVLLNTHIEAYTSDDTKQKQLEIFHAKAKAWSDKGVAVIVGGDFNTLPPHTQKLKGFDDSACKDEFDGDDHSMEIGWNQRFYDDFASAIPLEDYKANNAKYYSFTSLSTGFWNRTLDYLFTNQQFENGRVIQEGTMHLSDHAPLVVDFRLNP